MEKLYEDANKAYLY